MPSHHLTGIPQIPELISLQALRCVAAIGGRPVAASQIRM
jgi:hypothetical protein